MNIIEYVIPLGENARKRHCHETDKGRIIKFAVQLHMVLLI
jgi:hypothetical protein